MSDLLHYLAPLTVLGALIAYSRMAKWENLPKLIPQIQGETWDMLGVKMA